MSDGDFFIGKRLSGFLQEQSPVTLLDPVPAEQMTFAEIDGLELWTALFW
jgi:hypothetical protein